MGDKMITLCMIAKDEAELLPGCLASVADLVDEIVLVDTGSTDATREIAQGAGARVVGFEWCDDFSAARNAALPYATGRYVLILDADERLTPDGCARIREACESDQADCWMLPLHNADGLDAELGDVVSGARRREGVTYLPRLLRRTPDLAWEGVIHENPTGWLNRPGRRTRAIEAPIVHYGYASEMVASRDKLARNERLLRARCKADPASADPWIYLAKTLQAAGDDKGAWEAFDEAWLRVRAAPPAERRRATVSMMAADVLQRLVRNPAQLGLPYAEEALSWGLDHPNVQFFAGVALERAASGPQEEPRLRRAERVYRQALAWSKPPMLAVIPGLQSWLLPCRLGVVQCRLQLVTGEPSPDAVDVLQGAMARAPDDRAVRVALGEALTGAGRAAEALRVLEPVMDHDSPDAWWVAAWAVAALGDMEGAAQVLARAQSLGTPREQHRERRGATLAALIEQEAVS